MSSSSRTSFSIRLLLTISLLATTWLAQGQITFYQPPPGPGGFVGDFNGDGIPDLLGAGEGLLLGNGDGTFRDSPPLPAGGWVAVGDFKGDGKLDLLQPETGGSRNGTLLVLLAVTSKSEVSGG